MRMEQTEIHYFTTVFFAAGFAGLICYIFSIYSKVDSTVVGRGRDGSRTKFVRSVRSTKLVNLI